VPAKEIQYLTEKCPQNSWAVVRTISGLPGAGQGRDLPNLSGTACCIRYFPKPGQSAP